MQLDLFRDYILEDYICTVALLGPKTPVRRIARIVELSVFEVTAILEQHAEDFIEQHIDCEYFRESFNPQAVRGNHDAVVAYVREHLANPDHGAECIPYRFRIVQGYPSYRGKNLCWTILEAQHDYIDDQYRQTHKIEHQCGNRICINRDHFAAVPKSKTKPIPKPLAEVVADDPLLKPW